MFSKDINLPAEGRIQPEVGGSIPSDELWRTDHWDVASGKRLINGNKLPILSR